MNAMKYFTENEVVAIMVSIGVSKGAAEAFFSGNAPIENTPEAEKALKETAEIIASSNENRPKSMTFERFESILLKAGAPKSEIQRLFDVYSPVPDTPEAEKALQEGVHKANAIKGIVIEGCEPPQPMSFERFCEILRKNGVPAEKHKQLWKERPIQLYDNPETEEYIGIKMQREFGIVAVFVREFGPTGANIPDEPA